MSGINQSTVKVTLRNPLDHTDLLDYYIMPNDTQLAQDWILALKKLLQSGNPIEKNFCFLGFPKTARTLEYLCDQVNLAIETINRFDFTEHGLEDYVIEEWFHPNTVRFPDTYPIEGTFQRPDTFKRYNNIAPKRMDIGLYPKSTMLNHLHNHFERLQGTVNGLSPYYLAATHEVKYAIRQLNIICHEMETLILSQRKDRSTPEWVRPSQITTFLHAERYPLLDEHKQGFVTNGYDRVLGGVYMHWAQIGKTLVEVWRDEGAPKLTATICEAITHLEYYSGEFDVEWGQDVTLANNYHWHNTNIAEFTEWLISNGLDPKDPTLSLGFLPIGQIDLKASFGTDKVQEVWNILNNYLDIYRIEVDGVVNTFDDCWTDADYAQQQIAMMKSGYDYNSRR